MDTQGFWQLIEEARRRSLDPADGDAVAAQASALLRGRDAADIIAAQQTLWKLMADSYLNPLWAAAYVINGGCSDDAFDYFRGWLILQGQSTFELAVSDPDALADLPAVRAAADAGQDIDGEAALSIAWNAYQAATGEPLPNLGGLRLPELDPAWNFDFDDHREMQRRLPRLSALYLH